MSSEVNEEEESPDMDADYLDDYDSDLEEKRSGRRKRRPPQRNRGVATTVTPRPSRGGDNSDKPFLCSSKQPSDCVNVVLTPIHYSSL